MLQKVDQTNTTHPEMTETDSQKLKCPMDSYE